MPLRKNVPFTAVKAVLKDFLGGLKISFLTRQLWVIFLGWLCFAMSGCAKTVVAPPSTHEDNSIQTGMPGKKLEDLSPRSQASFRLTEQGRVLLEEGKASDAIRMLERAINLDPANGLNYYYLSEAWLFKGKFKQAEEFNGLARIYLEESPEWMVRVTEQEDRIQEFSK